MLRAEGAKPPSEGHSIRITVEGRSIAVFQVGGKLCAIDSKCTHVGGPLDEGEIDGTKVTCPWHGSEFDLTTGRVLVGPATKPVRAYRVRADASGLDLEPLSDTGQPGSV